MRSPATHVAWGAVRDAITAIHNLEALLKSPRVGTRVLAGVLHEFIQGMNVLRGAFSEAAAEARSEPTIRARKTLAEFARERLDELERTMQRAMTSDFDARGRLALEQVVTRVSIDLDAAAELLDLSDRAEHPMETEIALAEVAKVSLRGGGYGTDHEVLVRLDQRGEGCVLRVDPHVCKRLVAFAIARVHAEGAAEVSLRVSCAVDVAHFEIAPTSPSERALAPTRLRLVRRIEATDSIVEAAALSAALAVGARMADDGSGLTIRIEVPRVV